MDEVFFLHTGSLNVYNIKDYRDGLFTLASILTENNLQNKILKHNSIYNNPLYEQLLSMPYQDNNAILKYIEQCKNFNNDIKTDSEFENTHPVINAGFMGIDFSTSKGIAFHRQVTDQGSFVKATNQLYKNMLLNADNNYILICLSQLFPSYIFEAVSIDDLKYWKVTNKGFVTRIIDLLNDIKDHPFTGGIGKTEVLKKEDGKASKRINNEHRVVYTVNDNFVQIHRCKSHYD